MILVYTPDTGDEKRWDLAEVKVTFAEAKAAERAGNFTWRKLEQELTDGNVEALQAAVWVLRKRDEPTLRFADLESLPIDAIRTEYSADEKAFLKASVEADPDMTDSEKEAALAVLGLTDEPSPKDE